MARAARPAPDAAGTIYLVHFSARTNQGRQHYLGWTRDLEARLHRHRSGAGASDTKKAVAEGLKLTVAQTWNGTPHLEERLKKWSRQARKGFSGICPLCRGEEVLPPDLVRDLGPPSLRIRRLHTS
jgi:predicted GIY-YIG superfamily endonuclease